MTCSSCKHWQTIPVQGNERSEPAMIKFGYRNCLEDKSALGAGRYLHKDAKGCAKLVSPEYVNRSNKSECLIWKPLFHQSK